jgi:hypothetical protein
MVYKMCNPANQGKRNPERISDIGIDDIDFCEDYKYGECCDCVDCLTRQGVF